MEIIIKCAASALLATAVCLLLKRTNPELSVLISAVAIVVIMAAAMGVTQSIKELATLIRTMAEDSDVMVVPVLKCVGIGAITKISAELCRDAAQSSTAAAVDMAGTLCAIGISMPLIVTVLKLIGGMV